MNPLVTSIHIKTNAQSRVGMIQIITATNGSRELYHICLPMCNIANSISTLAHSNIS